MSSRGPKRNLYMTNKRVAILLSGCGVKDGSEITEAVSLMIALSEENIPFHSFAPNRDQTMVFDHALSRKQPNANRNILSESARISRCTISPLEELDVNTYSALVIPGGFGVASNLCDFLEKGKDAQLASDVKKVLRDFYSNKKVIGAMCIAPILLALFMRDESKKASLTLGSELSDAVSIIKQWGISHIEKSVSEICFDNENLFITSPAYMYDTASAFDILKSAQAIVSKLARLIER